MRIDEKTARACERMMTKRERTALADLREWARHIIDGFYPDPPGPLSHRAAGDLSPATVEAFEADCARRQHKWRQAQVRFLRDAPIALQGVKKLVKRSRARAGKGGRRG
jgi:hypothetical protein